MVSRTLGVLADTSSLGTPTPTPSAAAAASASATATSTSSPSSFYRNLFYILIGLLAAFGALSFFSLVRARRRRQTVIREAERLGLVVPGIPGYVPVRERAVLLQWGGKDGPGAPAIWDAVAVDATSVAAPAAAVGLGAAGLRAEDGAGTRRGAEWTKDGVGVSLGPIDDPNHDPSRSPALAPSLDVSAARLSARPDPFADLAPVLCPLALVPPPARKPAPDPLPVSAIPFFPNHLAYRAHALVPPPRVDPDDPDTWAGGGGGSGGVGGSGGTGGGSGGGFSLELAVVVRMPWDRPPGADGEQVMDAWGGVEIGVAKLHVAKAPPGES
ncbi:hypothetical protein Q5752_005518 [Cryptotrichosporon argae]